MMLISQYIYIFIFFISTLFSYGLNCGIYKANNGATFDLTQLTRQSGEPNYMVTDGDIPCTPKSEQNYTYLFNICGTVTSMPRSCKYIKGSSSAGALQIDSTKNHVEYCFIAGVYSETSTVLSLIDSNDPTSGVQVTYNGKPNDLCSNGQSRKFYLQMICADRLNPIPTHALEYKKCEYTVTVPSVYGCPVECPVANRRLCAGNGHCAYDFDANAARCFCNKGWVGQDCNEIPVPSSTTQNYSSALLGLIITLFIVIMILVGAMVLMVRQLAAYKEDITNYQALKGGEEDSATV